MNIKKHYDIAIIFLLLSKSTNNNFNIRKRESCLLMKQSQFDATVNLDDAERS